MGDFPNKATQFKVGKDQVIKSRRVGALGGKANKNNPNTIIAQRIRRMVERGEMTKEETEYLKARFDDPGVSAFSLYEKLEQAYKEDKISTKDFLEFKGKFHKSRHGDKLTIDQRVININVELKSDEVSELMEELSNE